MKSLYISGYNSKYDKDKIDAPILFNMIAHLSNDYDRVVVNVSSNLEMSILNFLKEHFKNTDDYEILSTEEVDLKCSEVEYNDCIKSLNLVMTNTPKFKSDIVMSTKFMNTGSDILLLDDKSNNMIVKYALEYAKGVGVHSYAIDLDGLRLIG